MLNTIERQRRAFQYHVSLLYPAIQKKNSRGKMIDPDFMLHKTFKYFLDHIDELDRFLVVPTHVTKGHVEIDRVYKKIGIYGEAERGAWKDL
jgi:hypothetical protein